MSGHSHWATIKHKKGAIDAKRGKLWSKLSRAIIIAARNGGGDPEMNLKLRYAIDKARASQHAQGQHRPGHQARHRRDGRHHLRGTDLRGHRPGGVAVLVDVLTDNRNRTNGEVRKIFERAGGKMGSGGSVVLPVRAQGPLRHRREGDRRRHAHEHRRWTPVPTT